MNPDRVLIVRFSSLGDIILTTAVVDFLKKKWPECEIHFLTLSEYAPILEGNPSISQIVIVDRGARLRSLRQLAAALPDRGYDLFLDLHGSLRSRYLRWWLKGQRWIVLKKPRLHRFLLFYFHVNRFETDHDIVTHYLKLLETPGVDAVDAKPNVYVSLTEKERVRRFLTTHGVAGPYIAAVPGAAWPMKIWSADGYSVVFDSIMQRERIPAVLLGGPKDSICDTIEAGSKAVVNLKGLTDLRTSLAILSCATAAVGGDTGLIHGAEAAGTPAVMIAGPTSWETGARVRTGRSAEVSANPWCRPCSKNGRRPCYRERQECMHEITPEMVLASLRDVMAKA